MIANRPFCYQNDTLKIVLNNLTHKYAILFVYFFSVNILCKRTLTYCTHIGYTQYRYITKTADKIGVLKYVNLQFIGILPLLIYVLLK